MGVMECVLVLALAGALGLGGPMLAEGDDAALLAAQLEILVLRASAPADATGSRDAFVLAGHSGDLTGRDAAAVIAQLAKPLSCSATGNASGVLEVRCTLIDSAEAKESLQDAVRVFDRGLGPGRVSDSGGGFDTLLLVRSPDGNELKLSLAVFRRWYHEYLPPPAVAFSDRRPTAEEQRDGIAHVIQVHRVENANPDSLPLELPHQPS